ncbi:gamma-glutamyl-gamma-aminobutyrate hydrolase family protein [Microbacteriaceae bacterium VKM Ac-2855]|nr:gamma-glutamyl-gamma-aminobutyrate hydrolase family protein [Microbacteriaceae bacterium VKM Ac-2855]
MNSVAITLRRDIITDRDEVRDALEATWWRVFDRLGHRPVLIPNHAGLARDIVAEYQPSAVLLTGGGTPIPGSGNVRDEVESMLLNYAGRHDLPLLGVCRGMQSIALSFGGALSTTNGHVRRLEMLQTRYGEHRALCFHEQGLRRPPRGFRVIARSVDGTIEAIEHENRPIRAIMWHPERNTDLGEADIALLADSLMY